MNKVALITVLGLGGALGAHASVDIGYQSQTTDASGTTAPGTQYAFFGNGGQPTSLAGDFTVSTTGDSVYNGSGNGSYSTVLTPGTGTSFRTGFVYDATSAYETAALVTFQVASAAITSFDVWVLTGDKQETAINIGFACRLITDDMIQFRISASSPEVDKLEAEGKVGRTLV